MLMVRKLSCFCVFEKCKACQNVFHVLPWWLLKLKLNNIKLVRDQMQQFEDLDDIEYDGNDKELSDLLQIGDNFVIPTIKGNLEGVDFYLFNVNN
jgi:hypothetical protein